MADRGRSYAQGVVAERGRGARDIALALRIWSGRVPLVRGLSLWVSSVGLWGYELVAQTLAAAGLP